MWRGAERWPETEENGEGEFRLGGVGFEVPMRWPGGAAQRLIGACGSAAQGRCLDIGETKHINLRNGSPGKAWAVGLVLWRVRRLGTESPLGSGSTQVSGCLWQGQFHSKSPSAMDRGVSGSGGEGPRKGSCLVLELWLLIEQLLYARCIQHSSSKQSCKWRSLPLSFR